MSPLRSSSQVGTSLPELAACIDKGNDATDGEPDTYDVYLFDRCFENYFWNYDNNGLKNLELRFYWEGGV